MAEWLNGWMFNESVVRTTSHLTVYLFTPSSALRRCPGRAELLLGGGRQGDAEGLQKLQ
jgi:hypothetical protein